MTDAIEMLKSLKRPKLLVRAARFGLAEYNRDRDLKKLMKTIHTPNPRRAVEDLVNEEARLEETRKTGDASYSVGRHIEVLIALMAEMRLLPSTMRKA